MSPLPTSVLTTQTTHTERISFIGLKFWGNNAEAITEVTLYEPPMTERVHTKKYNRHISMEHQRRIRIPLLQNPRGHHAESRTRVLIINKIKYWLYTVICKISTLSVLKRYNFNPINCRLRKTDFNFLMKIIENSTLQIL